MVLELIFGFSYMSDAYKTGFLLNRASWRMSRKIHRLLAEKKMEEAGRNANSPVCADSTHRFENVRHIIIFVNEG